MASEYRRNLKRFEVWLVTFTRGVYGQEEKFLFETDDKDSAEEFAHLEWSDDRAPDKSEFRKIEIRYNDSDRVIEFLKQGE